MVRFSKRQTRVIIALNLVVVLLLGGLFLVFPFERADGEPVDGGAVHDVFRSARVSLSVDLDFETNIGGSEDEELVACFASPDATKLHIFGNTNSCDLDFESGGIFFVVTDRKAKIESVVTFGATGDVLRRVVLADGGYLLAVDNTVSKTTHLLYVGYDGTTKNKLSHVAIGEENVADLVLQENCYMLIVHSGISLINFYDIKVYFYGLDFSVLSTVTVQNASYNQQYLGVLPRGLDTYVLAVNYKSDIWNGMALVELSQVTSQNKKIELENSYEACGFMPVSGGYAVLTIDSAKRASMLILSSKYELKEKKYLATGAQEARLFFASSRYFAAIKTLERAMVLAFDMTMSSYEDIMLLREAGLVQNTYMRSGGATIFASGGGSVSVAGLSDTQSWFKRVGSSATEDNAKLVFLGNDVFLICESTGSDGDVGANFGKKDIWIAKIAI